MQLQPRCPGFPARTLRKAARTGAARTTLNITRRGWTNLVNAFSPLQRSSASAETKRRRKSKGDNKKHKTEANSHMAQLEEGWGRLLYKYYNWRQDTSNDLQLVFLAFVGLIVGNAVLRALLVHASPPQNLVDFWEGMYEVIILSFGQEFPDVESGSIARQVFSVGVAGIGLSFLALVLALVEQVVLETIEQNVRQGSRVYETGHVLILGWCNSQRDLEVVWKILEQQCYAHRNEGGTVVVVLTQREKLEMEAVFRRAIPDDQRFGSRFVFRQGNPLIVQDLDMVAAKDAHCIMIVSDQSRCPEEADAQSLRCSILLDELTFDQVRRRPKSGTGTGTQSSRSAAAGSSAVLGKERGSQASGGGDDDRRGLPPPQVTWPIHGMYKQNYHSDIVGFEGQQNASMSKGAQVVEASKTQEASSSAGGERATQTVMQTQNSSPPPSPPVEQAMNRSIPVNSAASVAVSSPGAATSDGVGRAWRVQQVLLKPSVVPADDDVSAIDPDAASLPTVSFASHADDRNTRDGEGFTDFCTHTHCVLDWDEEGDGPTEARYVVSLPPRMLPPAPGLRAPFASQQATVSSKSTLSPNDSSLNVLPSRPSVVARDTPYPSILALLATQPATFDVQLLCRPQPPEIPHAPELPSACSSELPAVPFGSECDSHPLGVPLSSMDPELPLVSGNGLDPGTNGHGGPSSRPAKFESDAVVESAAATAATSSALTVDSSCSASLPPRSSPSSPTSSRDGGTGTTSGAGGAGATRTTPVTTLKGERRRSGHPIPVDSNRPSGHVIVEMKTSNAVPLLRFSCSSRFMAVPTSHLNARRLAKMIREPIIASISQQMLDFKNPTTLYVQSVPEMVGKRFGEMHLWFDDALVVGVYKASLDRVILVPRLTYQITSEDMLVLLRPNTARVTEYRPRESRVEVPATLSNWTPRKNDKKDERQSSASPSLAGALAVSASPAAVAEMLSDAPTHGASGTAVVAGTAAAARAEVDGAVDPRVASMHSVVGELKDTAKESLGGTLRDPDLASVMDREARAAARAVLMGDPRSDSYASSRGGAGQSYWTNSLPTSSMDSFDAADTVGRGKAPSSRSSATRATTSNSNASQYGSNSSNGVEDVLDPANFWLAKVAKALPGLGSLDAGDEEPFDFFTGRPFMVADKPITSRDESPSPRQDGPGGGRPTASITPTAAASNNGSFDRNGAPPASMSGSSSDDAASMTTQQWMSRVQSATTTGQVASREEEAAGQKGIVPALMQGSTTGSQDAGSLLDQQFDASLKSSSSSLGSFEAAQTNPIFMVPMEWLVADDRPRRVLVCGWGEQSFMRALLRELDQGQARLPAGSEIIFANDHPTDPSLGKATQLVKVRNVSVTHVQVDPLQRAEMVQLNLERFSAAIVLCDEKWIDPDEDPKNGVDMLGQADMLRLDSMVMMVQLNLRKILEDSERPSINIICQKVAMEGITRFEDRKRLPLGISVNFTSFAAKLLTQAAFSPLFLSAFSQYGASGDFRVIDASSIAEPGERLNWWQLVTRALTLRTILLGWYVLPERVQEPMEVVLNPIGRRIRSKKRVWNKGNNVLKFVVLQRKHNGVFLSHDFDDDDDDDVEDAVSNSLADLENRQATWVQLCVAEATASDSQQNRQGPSWHAGRVDHRDVESDTEGTVSWNDSMEEIEEQDMPQVVEAVTAFYGGAAGSKASSSAAQTATTRRR